MSATATRNPRALLGELRRPFPFSAAEQKGTYWYIGVEHVLDRANAVLGMDWSFITESISVEPAQRPTRDGGMRDGYEAVVSGHLVVHYRDEDGERQELKRPGSDSCFMDEQGAAIKGATSGAMVKAFSTLGVGRELYGKDAPRRAELDLIRLTLPRWVVDAESDGAGGELSLKAQLKTEAQAWRSQSPERSELTGSELSAAFRRAHGVAAEGDLTAQAKANLIVAAIECRRGARPYPVPSVEDEVRSWATA